ncbi:unnamed protein product [Triticum turgidum subsp. durum]|uniref:Cyclin-like domain-containing protein n=1 Tax=Triticum turgidum subsp. durum TaxID=4567 RepID=A0A9R1S587_TRITD|nr:unnamed protein product [Triticum turgidum subsp. durum]
MAARAHNNVAAAQQQNRALGGGGGGVPAMGKQQKAAMAGRPDPKNTRRALGDIGNFEANNRRAPLGDIANVVNVRAAEGKPQPHEPVNRPVTRNFGAQLLKNAQEKAKNPVARPAVRRAHHVKPAPPPPEHVIEISSDSDVTKSEAGSVSSVRKYSRKKVVTTLSHVLSARSKFAAGITEEPAIQDIDKLDGDNQLAVVDYIEDIYKFYKVAENECRAKDYMDSQVEINAKMRGILIDWILEVHQKFDLMPESLYLTVYIIDMYLSLQTVLRRELQLVGVSALLIACKYEEIWAPEVNDFILISDSAYTREQILKMEKAILNMLEWNLTVPTPYVFLVRFAKILVASHSTAPDSKLKVVYKKYSSEKLGGVALRPPATDFCK